MVRSKWLALSYSAPASPSKVRVFIWRRLRTIGAQQIRNGLAVLPNTKENTELFIELEKKIIELSGEATLMEMDFVSEQESRELERKFSLEKEHQLRSTLSDCNTLLDRINKSEDDRSKRLLEKELKRKLNSLGGPQSLLQEQAAELDLAASEIKETLKKLSSELAALLKTKNNK